MSGNAILGVSIISSVFDAEALFARNFKSMNSSKKLSGLSSEHGAHYELNATPLLQLVEALKISLVLAEGVHLQTIFLAHKQLIIKLLTHHWTRGRRI